MRAEPAQNHFRGAVRHAYEEVCKLAAEGDPTFTGATPSAMLKRYRDTFPTHLGQYKRSVSFAEVIEATRAADLVYVGDFHSMRAVKDTFCRIVAEGTAPERKPIIFLEEFQARHQRFIDGYMKGNLNENALRARAWSYNRNGTWGGTFGILKYANEQGIPVHGIDTADKSLDPSLADKVLAERTSKFADHIRRSMTPKHQVFLLAGEYHLAADKLPALLNDAASSPIVIFQNSDELFWELFEQGHTYATEAVQTTTGVYHVNTSNPLFRAMVQTNAEQPRGERYSKEELLTEYKALLFLVLEDVLKIKMGHIDPETAELTTLERLVYGTDDEQTVRRILQAKN